MISEVANSDISTRGHTKDTNKISINSAFTVLNSQKFNKDQLKGIKKLKDFLEIKVKNHNLDLWLSLLTSEPKNNNKELKIKNKKSMKFEGLAACDISGIDLLDDDDRKDSIDQTSYQFSKFAKNNIDDSLINETCNEILDSMVEQTSMVKPL